MKKPSLNQFLKTFQYTLLICNILSFLVLFLFLFDSYEFFSKNNLLVFPLTNFNLNSFFSTLKLWIFNSSSYFILIFFTQFFLHIIKNMFLFKSWLSYWDSENQISSLFSKSLINHFRWNKNIRIKTFIEIYNISLFQLNMLQYHSQNEEMLKFFKKHDPQFSKDIQK